VHAFAPDIAATPLELSYAESEALVACLQEVRFAERSQCRQLADFVEKGLGRLGRRGETR
jgi:hypothetical protein